MVFILRVVIFVVLVVVVVVVLIILLCLLFDCKFEEIEILGEVRGKFVFLDGGCMVGEFVVLFFRLGIECCLFWIIIELWCWWVEMWVF